jgi:hypothetical protein
MYNSPKELMEYLKLHNLEVYGRQENRVFIRNITNKRDKRALVVNFNHI